jgi:hypothetical protein
MLFSSRWKIVYLLQVRLLFIRVILIDGIQPSFPENWISNGNTETNKR